MFNAIISVDLYGPPCVKAKFWSNILNELEIDKNNPIVNAGIINGRMIYLISCHEFAPSILAASLTDSGICWICAIYTIIIYPDICHTVKINNPINPVSGFDSHPLKAAIPVFFEKASKIDIKINCQVNPSNNPPIIFGIKKIPRNSVAPLNFCVTNNARAKPTRFTNTTAHTEKSAVNKKACTNESSLVKMSIKFWKPTNLMSEPTIPFQFVRE